MQGKKRHLARRRFFHHRGDRRDGSVAAVDAQLLDVAAALERPRGMRPPVVRHVVDRPPRRRVRVLRRAVRVHDLHRRAAALDPHVVVGVDRQRGVGGGRERRESSAHRVRTRQRRHRGPRRRTGMDRHRRRRHCRRIAESQFHAGQGVAIDGAARGKPLRVVQRRAAHHDPAAALPDVAHQHVRADTISDQETNRKARQQRATVGPPYTRMPTARLAPRRRYVVRSRGSSAR